MNYQHRFVASLVVMSLVVFLLTLATRNLVPGLETEDDIELVTLVLETPEPEAIAQVQLPAAEDLAPMEDPMNLAVVVAVGLVDDCLDGMERSYYLPIHVQLGSDGVLVTRVEALPEDVVGREACISAGMHATQWPRIHGEPRWIKFSVPPTVTDG